VVITAIRERGTCVLTAPPGAGKTTRVPCALLDAGAIDGKIVVAQPRRLAAQLAASHIARARGGTAIELVTTSALRRRMIDDSELRGVGCVILDEFHERRLDGDLVLALCARLRAKRPELALIVMSATLDPEPIGRWLDRARILRADDGPAPVAIEYAEPDDRPLGPRVAAALRRIAEDKLDGDVLVFLPDAAEIRRCADELADIVAMFDLAIMPLHGELSADEQDAAVRPAARRKVILATNVAETAMAIDGVAAVIDSGLARVVHHSSWSGLPSQHVEPVSRASCTQRAHCAGRTRPGRAIRLYTKQDLAARRPFETPEILRADLAGAALELHGLDIRGVADLRWFDPPTRAAAAAAEELLARLGAVNREITPLGERMLRFPVHPRLARLICEAEDRGVAPEACVIAALLAREHRPARRGPAAKLASPSDLLDDLDAFLEARDATVDRTARELERIARCDRAPPDDDAPVDRELQIAILTAFPDRVGKRVGNAIAFASGTATLAPSSHVTDAPLVVAVDADQAAGAVSIRRASAIEASWLVDLYPDRVVERIELTWNRQTERVERIVELVYDGVAIDDSRRPAEPSPAATELLATHALAAGIAHFVDPDALAAWRVRVALVASLAPGVVAPTDDALRRIVAQACDGATSFAELRARGLVELVDASLGEHRAVVARLAPTHLELPTRRVAIHYEPDQPPWIAAPMQDLFGVATPSVGDGRVPLVVHLLAPNQRAVEVTQDLSSFWTQRYPALRPQLVRRYPNHAWPEDPTQK
jgi:ATP-dependent helicase HrpB